MPIILSYDGSTAGDWIVHYAVRMAARHPETTLHLVHVKDGRVGEAEWAKKIAFIQRECERSAVACQVSLLARRGSVADTVLAAVPAGADTFLICGTRVRGGASGWLTGSVAEQLLRSGHCSVAAMRVVQPGLLGLPRRWLLPVSGHPRGLQSAFPFLKLFAPDIAHLQILYVERVSRWQFRRMSHESAARWRQPGLTYCDRVEREILDQLGVSSAAIDASVVVSDDVPKEIVLAATRSKSRLISLGASERSLTERFLYGSPIEQVLRDATCDVAIYRGFA